MEKKLIEGFLLIHKPQNITSYDCIRHIKRIIKQRIKIGHTGTLDPFASGLMIIAIGRTATKQIRHMSHFTKTYIATAKLGQLTNTLDFTGNTLETKTLQKTIITDIENAVEKFPRKYTQTPPIFSALKYNGVPLHKIVRKKRLSQETLEKIVSYKNREIHINDIKLINMKSPFFTVSCTVSHGTYIRTLIHDIAKSINNYATTYQLKRTNIGPFALESAIKLNNVVSMQSITSSLIPGEHVKQLF